MYIHHYIYIEFLDRLFSRIMLDKISLVTFLKSNHRVNRQEHLSVAALEGCNCFFFGQL